MQVFRTDVFRRAGAFHPISTEGERGFVGVVTHQRPATTLKLLSIHGARSDRAEYSERSK